MTQNRSEGDSRKEIPKLYGKIEFDIIFIDGNHSSRYILSDAVNCWNILKEDGYLIFDDFFCESPVDFYQRNNPLPATLTPLYSSINYNFTNLHNE